MVDSGNPVASGDYGQFEGAAADRIVFGTYRATGTMQHVDHLVIEYWPAGLLRMGNTAEQLQTLLLRFPFGAFLNQKMLPDQMVPSAALLTALSWIATDGSDEGFGPARE